MVFCEVANIRYLWDKHFESMSKDYHRTMSNNLKCV
jgi:ATP-dependent DNA helicase PIF1